MLIRTDAAGATHGFAAACRQASCGFSLGFAVDDNEHVQAALTLPEQAWSAAHYIDGQHR